MFYETDFIMKKIIFFISILLLANNSFAQQSNWNDVEKVFGRKGSVQDNIFKMTFPRTDLDVKIDNFAVAPGLALTSWIGFMRMGDQGSIMGDLVLLDKEVGPVISRLITEGLSITALHNHLVNEVPAIKYVHFSGTGDLVILAGKIRSVLSITGTPLIAPQPSKETANPDWSAVESILGTTGKHNGKLLQYSFPRNEELTEGGMVMPAFMGMATAIPNHMLYDNPRLFMMHFWAVDEPGKLAKGLKEALDKTNSKK